jgi:hypothetical protein
MQEWPFSGGGYLNSETGADRLYLLREHRLDTPPFPCRDDRLGFGNLLVWVTCDLGQYSFTMILILWQILMHIAQIDLVREGA